MTTNVGGKSIINDVDGALTVVATVTNNIIPTRPGGRVISVTVTT